MWMGLQSQKEAQSTQGAWVEIRTPDLLHAYSKSIYVTRSAFGYSMRNDSVDFGQHKVRQHVAKSACS